MALEHSSPGHRRSFVIAGPRSNPLPSALLVGLLLLAVVTADRAIVAWRAPWAWAAAEVPFGQFDAYRVEGQLRTIEPGRQNVLIIGNSASEYAVDRLLLERRLGDRGFRFEKLSIAGAPILTWGFLADALAALQPSWVILPLRTPTVRSIDYEVYTPFYDAAAVPELFSFDEFLSQPRFHLSRFAKQTHVLLRHRDALQRAVLVRLGRADWETFRQGDVPIGGDPNCEGVDTWDEWLAAPDDVYPNPNTRALDRLARRLGEAGVTLLLVESPVAPSAEEELGERRVRFERFRQLTAEIAERHGVVFLDAGWLPPLVETDFSDPIHLGPSGERKISEKLAAYLAGRL